MSSPLDNAWHVGYRDAYYHSANNSRNYLQDSARTLSADQWTQYVDGYKKGASDFAATRLNDAWESVQREREQTKARLEELRIEIRAERISWGELAELQSLTPYIESGDVELLEWAGVPEFGDDNT